MEHTGRIDAVGDVGDVAGFRLVRRIGAGSRSEVYLGRPAAATGASRTAVLKLFRSDADGHAIDRQVRALLAVPPLVLPRLTDVATTPDGRACLVLERLAGPSLAGLLAERGRIAPGEVVTILATVTTALNAVHQAGFSHPRVTPAGVRFDGCGRPVLLGLGALEDLPAGAGGTARRRDDLVGLAGFARCVFDHLDQRAPEAAGTDAVLAAFESAATMRPVPADLTELEARLFGWAPAAAVAGAVPGAATDRRGDHSGDHSGDQHGAGEPAGTVPARRADRPRPGGGEVTRRRREAPRVPAGRRGMAAVAATGAQNLVSRVRRTVLDRWAGLARRGRTRGKPAALALGVAGLLVTGALMLPTGTDRSDRGGTAAAKPTSPATASAAAAEPVASLLGDDPAAAVLDLLRLRHTCLAEASVVCLDGVNQAGSVAMLADSYLVRQAQAGDAAPQSTPAAAMAALTATLQERTGNAALVVLGVDGGRPGPNTQPASALVIKGEAGWRLRELFDY